MCVCERERQGGLLSNLLEGETFSLFLLKCVCVCVFGLGGGLTQGNDRERPSGRQEKKRLFSRHSEERSGFKKKMRI